MPDKAQDVQQMRFLPSKAVVLRCVSVCMCVSHTQSPRVMRGDPDRHGLTRVARVEAAIGVQSRKSKGALLISNPLAQVRDSRKGWDLV